MKKLFVSVPMKGRTEEEIKASIQKMKKIAEICEGEKLEIINNYNDGYLPNDSVQVKQYSEENLKKLPQADIFIGICEYWIWTNCMIEEKEAYERGIKIYQVSGVGVIENYEAIVESLHVYEREILPK